jgi:hypothetical protein
MRILGEGGLRENGKKKKEILALKRVTCKGQSDLEE